MLTLQGMLAQAIHEDRIRGYENRARRHGIAARSATYSAVSRSDRVRTLVGRVVGPLARRTAGEPSAAPTRS